MGMLRSTLTAAAAQASLAAAAAAAVELVEAGRCTIGAACCLPVTRFSSSSSQFSPIQSERLALHSLFNVAMLHSQLPCNRQLVQRRTQTAGTALQTERLLLFQGGLSRCCRACTACVVSGGRCAMSYRPSCGRMLADSRLTSPALCRKHVSVFWRVCRLPVYVNIRP